MKTKQPNRRAAASQPQPYTKPEIEIIQLETTGTLMSGSPGTFRGDSIADPETSNSSSNFDWGGWGK